MRVPRENDREAGMAAFLVTTVFIMVVSLIIIGFSQVARRNQQEALDRQLTSQAFYAAESGVNQAMSVIRSKVASGVEPPAKTSCNDYSNYPALTLSTADNVAVTCMLVETSVRSMYYDQITENVPTVVPIVPAGGVNVGQLTLTWRSTTGTPNASATCTSAASPDYSLPTRSSWTCGHGILRVELAPKPTGAAVPAVTSFFYPHKVSTSIDNDSAAPAEQYAQSNGILIGYCSDAGSDSKCKATITDLGGPIYYMNLRSIYRNSTVTITGLDTSGQPLKFKGQVNVDVTAKAQDVIKRMQVRLPITPQGSGSPGYAVESKSSVCKRFSVYPGYYNEDNPALCP